MIFVQEDLTVTVLGQSLRQIIPKIIGETLNGWFEIIKPLVEFKFEVILSRSNNMWELATVEEIDNLGEGGAGSSSGGFSDGLDLDLDVSIIWFKSTKIKYSFGIFARIKTKHFTSRARWCSCPTGINFCSWPVQL